MTSSRMRGFRRGRGLLAAGTMWAALAAAPAHAQNAQYPQGAVVQPLPDRESGAELRRHLTTLADNPRSLSALVGAGRAALDMGDAAAALSFFARADEVSPRDARVKAGIASAFVLSERAQAALGLFAEAVSLGAPEAEIAGDRGLAFDMLGDPRRAQQDYALVLRRGDHDEVRRRLALSLAISGRRDAALRILEPQLTRGDRSAWRAQAFVLALTGDAAGADATAARMMSPQAARSMAPFFARLASLSPAQKAMAVHFGHFPSDGRADSAGANVDVSPDPGALALAGVGPQPRGGSQTPVRTRPVQTASREPRRRPGRRESGSAARGLPLGPRPLRNEEAARQPQAQPPAQQPPVRQPVQQPPVGQPVQQQPIVRQPVAQPPQPARSEPATRPVELAELPPSRVPAPGFDLSPSEAQPDAREPEPSPPPPPAARDDDLADIAALVEALPDDAEPAPPPARETPRRTQPAPARSEAPARQRRARAARPAHPSRHWVQIAGGADKSALPREFARLRALAPAELAGQSAWTTPLRATNRLLVGPFDSAREAQAFVNRLAEREVEAFAWTSEEGQAIERLPARR